ncbi:MAG: hypothetical protein RL026_539 [Pseudomonadota bacterium]
MTAARILIVDDEPDLLELAALAVQRMGHTPVPAASLAEARQRLRDEAFALVLCDMRLPDGDGLDLLAWAQRERPRLPFAILTAHGNVECAVRALKGGAFDFLGKPLDLGVLRRMVHRALQLPDVDTPATGRSGTAGDRPAPSALLGDSEAMQRLRAMIARVARSQAPVHIRGESGSGKERVARLIHASGARAGGPFVAVNCGAVPAELMESEFFGHRRGAFTGAVADRSGLLQAAEGGTLFLDEIADLPLHMQVKLLRVVQEKRVRPVGDTREQAVDVRLLSATHKDLAALVKAGQFREDLYYRIHVIELQVPALRERREDLPALAQHLLQRLAGQGLRAPQLLPDALAALQSYDFPGNVRELENILERALALGDGQALHAADLQLPVAAPPQGQTLATAPAQALGTQLELLQREAILKALEDSRHNKTEAARRLGVSFRQLRYRIKKLGLEARSRHDGRPD